MINLSNKDKLYKIYNDLVNERTNFLLYQNSANPDVGWGLTRGVARDDAIKSLQKENLIPADFE